MSSLFEDLKEGLEEAIACEKGYGAGRVKTYMILPVKEYSGKEIRDKGGDDSKCICFIYGSFN